MCTCTYYSLFRLGIFRGLYFMVPGCTSPYSLLVNAALMCRFAPALCYNFMHIIHVDNPKDGQCCPPTSLSSFRQKGALPLQSAGFPLPPGKEPQSATPTAHTPRISAAAAPLDAVVLSKKALLNPKLSDALLQQATARRRPLPRRWRQWT